MAENGKLDEKVVDVIAAASKGAFNDAGECVKPLVGLEFFPPRTTQGVDNLRERLQRLKKVGPVFADFTWGAGGSTADLTLDLTLEAKHAHGLRPNMHLTCTNMPLERIESALRRCREEGVTNIVALRGDPPVGADHWERSEGGLGCALDLVGYVREHYGDYFCISVAGYPEGHPDRIKVREGGVESLSESELTRYSVDAEGQVQVCGDEDWEAELAYLKAKCDAGADVIITQMFFDASVYGRFVQECRRVGITAPVIPGIMCINAYAGFQRMTGLCKTRVPPELRKRMEAIKDDDAAIKAFGVEYGEELCRALLKHGAPVLHFYTLNLEKVTVGILRRLGLAGEYEAAPAAEKLNGTAAVTNGTAAATNGTAPVPALAV
eukprot:TRINITY_DN2771_c0_g2_i1.p1 TRINITY_DN2771_c0_g2~~TRINITY_DN2771_c0_g2_i1.p1  ORF type:complete len:380 (-),score=140.62 TRINITY_DN2771_c0_g2_i1:362-1501(-)